jgi:hypothetical protein
LDLLLLPRILCTSAQLGSAQQAFYWNGVGKEIIGKVLKRYNIPRHKVVILSKCFAYVGDEPWMKDPPEVKLLFA